MRPLREHPFKNVGVLEIDAYFYVLMSSELLYVLNCNFAGLLRHPF